MYWQLLVLPWKFNLPEHLSIVDPVLCEKKTHEDKFCVTVYYSLLLNQSEEEQKIILVQVAFLTIQIGSFCFFPLERVRTRSCINILPLLSVHGPQEGVNYINILWAAFLSKSVLYSFYVLTTWVCNLLTKEKVRALAAYKIRVKLPTRVNFINILCEYFFVQKSFEQLFSA